METTAGTLELGPLGNSVRLPWTSIVARRDVVIDNLERYAVTIAQQAKVDRLNWVAIRVSASQLDTPIS